MSEMVDRQMTKREAKKYIVKCIQAQLASDIDNGSAWLFRGYGAKDVFDGDEFSEADQARVLAALREFIDADTIIAKKAA